MDELISKSALKEDLLKRGFFPVIVKCALNDAPAVDAVEVVRCRDCKNYGWEQNQCHGRTERFCKLHKGLVVVARDSYCSYGERKTDA